MVNRTLRRTALLLSLAALLVGCNGEKPGSPVQAQTPGTVSQAPETSSTPIPYAPDTEEHTAIKKQAQEEVQEQSVEKQKEIVAEAVTALDETYKALELLSQSNPKEALAAVEKATGKLEIILAREPGLALAPVAVSTRTHDLIVDPNDVEKLVKESRALLEEGKVQAARKILAGLASETVISTTSIPLGTYPDALKLAAKQIDDGKPDEAALVLSEALSTQVVTDVLIPLPLARARLALVEAEMLAEKPKRTPKEEAYLIKHLDSAEKSARLAKALGYGTKADFKLFFNEIEELREKTANGKSGEGFFDKIKKALKSLDEQAAERVNGRETDLLR